MKKVVVIGGGTGTFTVLSGLKKYHYDLTAVVSMADSGGSTGHLRDEFGVLPPGDVRQCLVALAEDDTVMRELFNYRYKNGDFAGHSFGNIFLSTLESITGSIEHAIEHAGRILNIRGRVIPVTLTDTHIVTELKNGKVLKDQYELREYQLVSKFGVQKMYMKPKAKGNPAAIKALKNADVIIVGPGNLYGSLTPNFLIDDIGRSLIQSKAKKIYIANLMNKHGHTDNFTVVDCVRALEKVIGSKNVFDVIVYNTKKPATALLRRYSEEGELLNPQFDSNLYPAEFVGKNLLADDIADIPEVDIIRRTLIRHDSAKLAKVLNGVIEHM